MTANNFFKGFNERRVLNARKLHTRAKVNSYSSLINKKKREPLVEK